MLFLVIPRLPFSRKGKIQTLSISVWCFVYKQSGIINEVHD